MVNHSMYIKICDLQFRLELRRALSNNAFTWLESRSPSQRRIINMRRRDFGVTVVAGAAGLGVGGAANPTGVAAAPAAGARANPLMHVGGDYHHNVGRGKTDPTSDANLQFILRHGVRHLTVQIQNRPDGKGWDLDILKRMRDNCDRHGVVLEAIRMDPD